MSENPRQFYLEQLRARLQYYQEIGIDGLSLKAYRFAEQPEHSVSSEDSAQFGPVKNLTKESRPSVGGNDFHAASPPAKKSPSLFEDSPAEQPSAESLEEIRADLGDCQRCKLCSTRSNIVFGSGSAETKLVFVGEGPGADEDAQGLPFVGRAGQLLTKIIEAIQLKREQVYICNVVKCRPPGNRFPEADEIAACTPFLFRQLDSIRPQVICCLGTAAAQTVLHTKLSIGKLRGRFHDYQGMQVMPTYHPSYLLRNPEAKRDVWEDMKKVKALLDELD